MRRKNNRCAIYGSRDKFDKPDFSKNTELLNGCIDDLISKGINTFVTEANEGYELDAAKYIIELKKKNENIHLVIARPYRGSPVFRETRPVLQSVMKESDMVKYIFDDIEEYYPEKLNDWIIARCDTVLCITNSDSSKISRLEDFDLSEKSVLHIPERMISATQNAGSKWTDKEEQQLIEEFQKGFSISDIAKIHGRNRGGIRSRLKRLGLIDHYSRPEVEEPAEVVFSEPKKKNEELKTNNLPVASSGLKLNDVVIHVNRTSGDVCFHNFEELKSYLRNGLATYNVTDYSIENIDQAQIDYKLLKALRKKLTDRQKALQKEYLLPVEKVLKQMDELIDMVKEPYLDLHRMLRESEKELKRLKVMEYAKSQSFSLGNYADRVINSPSFYNQKWSNASCREGVWTNEIKEIINNAERDIRYILEIGGEKKAVLLEFYFDKLTLDGVESLLQNIEEEPEQRPLEIVYIEAVTGEVVDIVNIDDETEENLVQSEPVVVTKSVKLTGNEDMIQQFLSTAKNFGIIVE